MPIDFQQFAFTFRGGLNSESDEFQLQSPQLLQADNVRFVQDGNISKRPGTIALTKNIVGGGELSKGVACQVFNDELLAFDGTYVYSYSQSLQAWMNRGLAISIINNQRKIINNRVSQQNNPDGNNLNGLECYVWEDSQGGMRYSIIDSKTGTSIVSDKQLYFAGAKPKVIALPEYNQFNIYYLIANNTLNLSTIKTEFPTETPSITNHLFQDGNPLSYTCYDVALIGNDPIVAYESETGINVNYLGHTSQFASLPGSQITAISVYVNQSDKTVWVSYACQTGIFVCAYRVASGYLFNPVFSSINLLPYLANPIDITNIAMIGDINSQGAINLTYEVSNYPDNYLTNNVIDINGRIEQTSQVQRSVGLASKPFKYDNQLFINTVYQSINQSTYFTLCITQNMKCVNKMNPGVGGNYRNNGLLAECVNFADNSSIFMFANQLKGAFTSNNNTSYSLLGVNSSYIDFENTNSFNSIIGANNLHVVGGVEKIYDGISFVEDNFHLYSEITNLGVSQPCLLTIGAGGGLQQGQYQYIICYEWTDANNQVHRGQPSIPLTIQISTNNSCAILQIPTLRITDKVSPRSNVSIAVFRTILQSGVESDTFYKVTNDSNPIINDITVDLITFTDLMRDDQIQANEPLYTSEQLFNQAPPANSLISSYQTRIFLSGMEDPNIIWTSQDRFDLSNYNTIPIEFSPLLVEGVDPTGGPITAIHSLDQAMIIFKEDAIFYFNGDGPNANGTTGSFSNAIPIPSNNGCINQNSIISIPANQFNAGGLMYQSSKGIYLVDRSYNVQYIGANVEKYNNYHITSVEIIDDEQEVVFITLEGICLVYNYHHNRWTTWSYLPAVDSCIYQGKLTLIQSDGTVLIQKDNYYYDYTSNTRANGGNNYKPIIRTIQIPWLAFAGLQGYQSINNVIVIGHYLSPHIINMSVMYNYDPNPTESISINSNSLVTNTFSSLPNTPTLGSGIFTPYQWQMNFGYPMCQSLSLLISDLPLTGDNEASIWTALTFEVGVVGNQTPLAAHNKYSGNKKPNTRLQ